MDSIKKARKRVGLSLTEVADRCGMLSQAIARAERTGIDPKASTVATIAEALGLPVCELYPRTGHERRQKKA
jgi:transcriptional regulator with XRE-family HTH domain